MPKRKTTIKNPLASELPQGAEFQQFVQFTRKLVSVPKEEIDRRIAEEKEEKGKEPA